MALAAKPATTGLRKEEEPLDERDAQAVVTIDAEAAEILSANALGAAALGLFPYASFPVALDQAMPAIARLRQIATTGTTGKGDIETLLFWKSGQLRRVKCRVKKHGKKGSKALVLHVVEVETPPDVTRAEPRSPTGTSVPFAKGGMEILREIAEQLRQARAVAEAQPAASPVADVPTPAPLPVLDAEYLAKLAHELKTPLTAIAAAAEIMRDERLGEMKNERYLNYAADIHESATHALDVIAAFLSDRAKPSVPASRLIALDLNALVERTASSVQALAESCGLTLSFESDGSHPHVVANPTALRQVLLNLLTNAIKFTPRGGDVLVATGHIGDGRVSLVVRDTGCGMTETSSPAIETSGNLQPAWARSNGIGLPLVEKLVRDMGAEIEIESAPQKGTAATIIFNDFTRQPKHAG